MRPDEGVCDGDLSSSRIYRTYWVPLRKYACSTSLDEIQNCLKDKYQVSRPRNAGTGSHTSQVIAAVSPNPDTVEQRSYNNPSGRISETGTYKQRRSCSVSLLRQVNHRRTLSHQRLFSVNSVVRKYIAAIKQA